MTVTVKLHAGLKKFAPDAGSTIEVELPAGAIVADAVRGLGIPEKFAGMVFVGSERSGFDVALREGQEVSLFPPLGGG